MNLDATTALLVVILAGFVRDGLLAWRLLGLLGERGGSFPPTPPVGPPITPPVVPPVVVPPVVEPPVVEPPVVVPPVIPPVVIPPVVPAPGTPRFTVTSTDFAGPNDSASSSESAYDEHIIRGATELAAALPYHFPGPPPAIRVFANSRTVDVPIKDVGPWNTHDPYWDGSGHPLAESQYANQTKAQNGRVPTNPSGLDLTPAAYKALGFSGDLNNITTHLSWDFVSVLDKGTVAPSVPVPPVGPAQSAAPVVGDGLIKNTWPTQADCPSFYGNAATVAASLVTVHCPWLLTVEGTHTQNITIHSKCAASLTRVLNYIWNHPSIGQSQDKINAFGYNVFDGSYNPRNIAGTSTPSVHSYAAAMDWNAAANPQHAPLSQTKFKEDSLIVFAFKAEGWIWGGDWSPASIDAMHVQAARVR